MSYLPAMVEGIKEDPKYKGRRNCFLTNHNSKTDHPLLQLTNRRQFPLLFTEDASKEDNMRLMEGQLAETVLLQYPEDSFFSYGNVVLSSNSWVDEPTEV